MAGDVHSHVAGNQPDIVPRQLLVALGAGAGQLYLTDELGQLGPVHLDLDLLELVAEFPAGASQLEGNLVHPRIVNSPELSP